MTSRPRSVTYHTQTPLGGPGGAFLVLLMVLAGCASLSPQRMAARKIEQALPQVFGPADTYHVTVDGDAGQLSRGRARAVHITGTNVQLSDTVTLDTLQLDAADISFNKEQRTLEHVGTTRFAGTIGQAHLDAYLTRTPNPFGLRVQLRQSDVVVTLPITAGPLRTSVAVAGHLVPDRADPSAINFSTDRARLGLLPVPAFAVNAVLDELGPVVRLSGFKVPVAVETIQVRDGALLLRGTAQLQNLSR